MHPSLKSNISATTRSVSPQVLAAIDDEWIRLNKLTVIDLYRELRVEAPRGRSRGELIVEYLNGKFGREVIDYYFSDDP